MSTTTTDGGPLVDLLSQHPDLNFLQMTWIDLTAQSRSHVLPLALIKSLLVSGQPIKTSLSHIHLGLTQVDTFPSDMSPSGESQLVLDVGSVKLGGKRGYLMGMGEFVTMEGQPVMYCPRGVLKRTLQQAADELRLFFVLGFEIEVVFMRRSQDSSTPYLPLQTDGHAFCITRAIDHPVFTILEETTLLCQAAGVSIEALHPESATGQYEIVTFKLPALQAVDTLVYVRDVPTTVAGERGYKATMHPKTFREQCGTGTHVHMSFSSCDLNKKKTEAREDVVGHFYAGFLQHLRAVCAFTYSCEASYERDLDGCWSGGTYTSRGTQNREAPLRKIEGSHWEIRCIDGLANPYLAGVGSDHLYRHSRSQNITTMEWKDLGEKSAVGMSEDERKEYGLEERLPRRLGEALEALEEDVEFKDWVRKSVGDMVGLRERR